MQHYLTDGYHLGIDAWIRCVAALALVLFLAGPTVVRAEPVRVREAAFVTLDRIDGSSSGRVELAFGWHTEHGDFLRVYDVTSMRLEAHLQWVSAHGIGGYTTAGVSKYVFDGDVKPLGFPQAELGGLYAGQVHENVDAILRAGIAFPLRDSSYSAFVSGLGRIADFARNQPGTT